MACDIRETARMKLGYLTDAVEDEMLDMAIDEAATAIKEFCHLGTEAAIPPGLFYTHANMAVDLIRYNHSAAQDPAKAAPAAPTSVKVGDTSIEFGSGRTPELSAHNGNLDRLVMNYSEQLKSYRRVLR